MGWLIAFVRRDLLRTMRLAFLLALGSVVVVSLIQIVVVGLARHAVVTSSVVLLALVALRVVEYRLERPVAPWIDVLELGGLFAVLVQVRIIDIVLGSIFFLALFRSAVSRLGRLVPVLVGYIAVWLGAAWFAPQIMVYPGAVVSLLVVGPMVYCVRILLLRLREQHMAQSAMLESVLRQLPFPVVVTGPAGAVVLANPAALTLLGWASEQTGSLSGLPVTDVGGAPIDLHEAAIGGAFAGAGSEVRVARPDGSSVNVQVETVPMADEAGMVIALLDVSAQRMYEETLHHAAYSDSLTGLPNRALLWQHLDAAGRGVTPYGVLLIDLDHFKNVNDTLGHRAGDELLTAVAGRLRDAAGERALVARLGGDEFAVLAPDATRDRVEALAAAFRATFDTPFALSTGPLLASGTVGTAVARPGQSPDDVMASADAAMYGAKPGRYRPGSAASPAPVAGAAP